MIIKFEKWLYFLKFNSILFILIEIYLVGIFNTYLLHYLLFYYPELKDFFLYGIKYL